MAEFITRISADHTHQFSHGSDGNTAMIISIAAVVGIVLISIISYVVVSLWSHTGGSETSGDDDVTQRFQRENPMTVFRADHGGAYGECTICLEEFEEEDKVRKLSGCGHQFHTACVDRWVASRSRQPSCPTCRGQIV